MKSIFAFSKSTIAIIRKMIANSHIHIIIRLLLTLRCIKIKVLNICIN